MCKQLPGVKVITIQLSKFRHSLYVFSNKTCSVFFSRFCNEQRKWFQLKLEQRWFQFFCKGPQGASHLISFFLAATICNLFQSTGLYSNHKPRNNDKNKFSMCRHWYCFSHFWSEAACSKNLVKVILATGCHSRISFGIQADQGNQKRFLEVCVPLSYLSRSGTINLTDGSWIGLWHVSSLEFFHSIFWGTTGVVVYFISSGVIAQQLKVRLDRWKLDWSFSM